jgi:hypothetical protein
MAADFSKVRSNPLLDYAGVELKQGGVVLDADANELVAILDRRLRALAGDVLGRATVGANTPDAFKITVSSGMLNIGRGRLYVDGLLAECHGAGDSAQRELDDLMAETRFTQPVTYATQPYFSDPPALPTGGRHLVYLDVWQRQVTHLEQPDLVDTAVGVEASSRLQTVWQVRVLADDAGTSTTCASPDADLEGWANLIAPSSGRLTTGTYEVSTVNDPCELPPTGGYRGLENQLYRIEVHDPGQPGAGATFKWSRENASVGSRVASMISATSLELESLGRDDVLRFNTDDWVEIVDDARELAQLPGEMRKITVDEANRRITFAPALPAAMLPGSFPNTAHPQARNLRVRRWDQRRRILRTTSGGATALHQDLDASTSGVINVPAAGTTLLLENGVTVSFASTGAKGLRSGDYWVFAARTADASVELLDAAPPRGIHHHYARLSLWDAGTTADPTDCRHPWPPVGGDDCGCTACVTPESHASGQLTIQAAVDRVRDTGGTVCLKAGQYTLQEAVRLAGARSIRIKGQGAATMIAAPAGAFDVRSSIAVVIENLAVISLGRRPAIAVQSGAGITLRELIVLTLANQDFQAPAITLSGAIAGLAIRDSLIVGPHGIRALDPELEGAPRFLITANLRIDDNILWCERRAIQLEGTVGHAFISRIQGNEVLGCRDGAISVLGVTLPGGSMRIADNSMNVDDVAVRCGVDGAWIEGNKIRATPPRDGRRTPGAGIALVSGLDPNGSDQGQILANQISGFAEAGIRVQAPARDLIIKLNIIEDCGNGILMEDAASAGSLSIENNHLRNIGPLEGDAPTGTVVGIAITRTQAAAIVGNTLRQIGLNAPAGTQLLAGIVAFGAAHVRISGNELSELSPFADLAGTSIAGLMVAWPYTQAEIANNSVERDPQATEQSGAAFWSGINVEAAADNGAFSRAGAYTSVRIDDTRTLVLHGSRAYVNIHSILLDVAGARVPRASASLRGNSVSARGSAPAVMVRATTDIQFSDNRCELRGERAVAVRLDAPAAVVSANVVRGGDQRASIAIGAQRERAAVLGNATSFVIMVAGGPLADPWKPLNVAL